MHHALKIVTSSRRLVGAVTALAVFAACVHRTTPFERYVEQEQWLDAAREFESDTTLRSNERDLFAAGVLYGTPGRTSYDLAKARETWRTFLMRFPASPRRGEAAERLALVEEVLHTQQDASVHAQELQDRIAQLERDVRGLRAHLDSLTATSDSLRNVISRAEVERRDRESQLNALRLELQRLKDIDLKRPPARIRPSVY